MSSWFTHDALGRILAVGGCPDGDEPEYDGETTVVGTHADIHRQWYDVSTGQLEPRAKPIIVVDGYTLTNIPVPSALEIRGPVTLSTTVEDDTLELTFDVPGTYTLRFEPEHPQWFETTVTIEVSE